MVIKSVANGWIHQMRARCTTVLLTQKLVRIGWNQMFSFQSIAYKLQNVITWSAASRCITMCRTFCTENSCQQLWHSLMVHILSIQVRTVKQKKIASEPRIAAVVTKGLRETGTFNYYVRTWGGWGRVVTQNANVCQQEDGVSHQCERSYKNFFD